MDIKSIWTWTLKSTRTKRSQDNFKNKARGLSLPGNRVCYKATVIGIIIRMRIDRWIYGTE